MSYYSVVAVTPTNEDWIGDYLPVTDKLIDKHGGTLLARTASHERLEGDGDNPTRQVIIEWPSKGAATAFHNDPEYQPQLQARLNNSTSHHVLIEGTDDFA